MMGKRRTGYKYLEMQKLKTEKGGLRYDPSQAHKLVLNTKIDVPDPCLHTGTVLYCAA